MSVIEDLFRFLKENQIDFSNQKLHRHLHFINDSDERVLLQCTYCGDKWMIHFLKEDDDFTLEDVIFEPISCGDGSCQYTESEVEMKKKF